jgi:hypothetical protein
MSRLMTLNLQCPQLAGRRDALNLETSNLVCQAGTHMAEIIRLRGKWKYSFAVSFSDSTVSLASRFECGGKPAKAVTEPESSRGINP